MSKSEWVFPENGERFRGQNIDFDRANQLMKQCSAEYKRIGDEVRTRIRNKLRLGES